MMNTSLYQYRRQRISLEVTAPGTLYCPLALDPLDLH